MFEAASATLTAAGYEHYEVRCEWNVDDVVSTRARRHVHAFASINMAALLSSAFQGFHN
jgi:hypothetical protein